MKKILFTSAFVVFAFFAAQAQIGAGTISVGGALEISTTGSKFKGGSSSVDGPTSSSFTFGPQAGYFLSDNLSVGAAIQYRNSTTKSASGDSKNTTNAFIFSPFARYHMPMGEKFYLFGEARVGFGFGGGKVKSGGNSSDKDPSSTIGMAVSPGILFFPGEKVGIELAFNILSFDHYVEKDADDKNNKSIQNTFSFGPNLFAPQLSVQFYF